MQVKLIASNKRVYMTIVFLCFIVMFMFGCNEKKDTAEIEEFLPIVSIVRVNKIDQDIMIFGRSIEVEGHEEYYDYAGLPYPIGYINLEQTCVFEHADIQKVIFKGYSNDEERKLNKELHEVLR